MRIAVSSAHALLVVLMLRVASTAARASAPTWSTPGRPCRKRRSEVSSRVASPSAATSPPNGLLRVALTAPVYGRRANRPDVAAVPDRHGRHAVRGIYEGSGHAALGKART